MKRRNKLIKEVVEQRIERLKEIINQKQKALSHAPKGIINVCDSGKKVQYYYKDDPKAQKKYMRKSQMPLITKLCQRDYDEKVLENALRELAQWERVEKELRKELCEDVYGKLNKHRQKLVQPIELPEDEYVRNWLTVEYPQKGFDKDAPEFYTELGERVRSKSEILIANMLKREGIPYKYEEPLYLNGFGMVHPDFVGLNVRTRKEIRWEHLGKMDDIGYVQDNMQKIQAYENNGYYLGDELILTYETIKRPLNVKHVEKMINHYFK